jgi:hypothetical protein
MDGTIGTLQRSELRNSLIRHPLFREIQERPMTRDQVAKILGQWWHPLHYFPTFLARLIATVEPLSMKTQISKILWQELGEGDPERAHERVYISTMTDAGFDRSSFVDVPPLSPSADLVAGYAAAATDECRGLGFLYGTEVADLAMVTGIGRAVRRVTGLRSLPWVDIHALQEPAHVVAATGSIAERRGDDGALGEASTGVRAAADKMWQLWIAFFDAVQRETFA